MDTPRCKQLLALLLVVLPDLAPAAIELSTTVERVEGEGWRIGTSTLVLRSGAAGIAGLVLKIDEIELPDARGVLQGVELSCASLAQETVGWHCEGGKLIAEDSPVGAQEATWQGVVSGNLDWRIDITGLKLARGTVGLQLSAREDQWSVDLRLHRLAVVPLVGLADRVQLPRGWEIKGRTSGAINLQGDQAGPNGLDADLVVDRLGYASPDGRHAAEDALLKLDADGRKKGTRWSFDASIAVPKGAFYADPVFVDTSSGALSAGVRGGWDTQRQRLRLDACNVALPGVVDLTGTGRLRGPGLAVEDLTVVARSDRSGSLYETLLQPFLIGSAADDLEMEGSIGLVLHLDSKGIEQAGLELSNLVLADRQGRFSLGSTDGSVAWDRETTAPMSRLTVQDASIYQIPTGGFSIEALFAGDRIGLQQPVVVPISGGEVRLDSFDLSGALVAGEKPRWKADASVRGISLQQLTTALDWPPFGGLVEGQLRDMRYVDQLFTVGGGLHVEAFDGRIVVENLQIREPLGPVPVLTADAELRGLSLLALTEAFSFGRIEGRLDGEIEGIRLLAWQPDGFEMHLYTPSNDDLRHRISQRAVENLTEIGSGVSAGLSTTFLRVFEEFRYDRIDLTVALQGEVAELDGLARPDGGYYLVKGAGLPRIDVIGRNRSVAWKDLVERLRRIRVEEARIE